MAANNKSRRPKIEPRAKLDSLKGKDHVGKPPDNDRGKKNHLKFTPVAGPIKPPRPEG